MKFTPILERDIRKALMPTNLELERERWVESGEAKNPVFKYDKRKIRKLMDRARATKEALCFMTSNNDRIRGGIYSIINNRKKELYDLLLFLDTCLRKDSPLCFDDTYNKKTVSYEEHLSVCVKENAGVKNFLKYFGCPQVMRESIDRIIENDLKDFRSIFSEEEKLKMESEKVDSFELKKYIEKRLEKVLKPENMGKKENLFRTALSWNREIRQVEFFPFYDGGAAFLVVIPRSLEFSKLEMTVLGNFAVKYFEASLNAFGKMIEFEHCFKDKAVFNSILPILAHSLEFSLIKATRLLNSILMKGSDSLKPIEDYLFNLNLILSGQDFTSVLVAFCQRLVNEGRIKDVKEIRRYAFDRVSELFFGQRDTSSNERYVSSFAGGDLEGLLTVLRLIALKEYSGLDTGDFLRFATLRIEEANRIENLKMI